MLCLVICRKAKMRLNGDPQHLLKDRNAISFYKENNQEQPLLVASKHFHNGYVVWEVLAARMDLGYKSSGNVRGCLTVKGSIFNEPDI